AGVGIKPWPWAGAVRVTEHHAASGRTRLHVFDRWCHLGSVAEEAAAVALAARAPRAFDVDVWRMVGRWLAVPAHLQQVAPLPAGEA
ncbi:MAG TPA: ethanolamine utilization protein, partial [Thauera sp.]|nr:ethanolamine utilization protein [Thauera sp.]